ncbi:MAG TPA: SGNH/GDSL hydrolase family protein, partial [Pyrinomonadaceae bacterium]|nr:SGNH/GDSL hydrolase family protein [Pyrinomonadaceae bacterium]
MKRPPESLKSFANRVGRVAASDEAAQAVNLLHLAGFLDGSTERYIDDSDHNFTDPVPDQVGIWERKTENGKSYFVRRPETRPEWLFWANIGRIEAKGTRQRVVLIGESVTRGYLYDPQYTPAIALQAMLDAHGDFEVIDLARTSLNYQVRKLAIEALQLEPDIAIVFAGNNWSASGPTALEFAHIDAALATDGIAGAKRATEAQLLRKARRTVHDISTAYESKGIPLVWIIPEFNLTDWRDPHLSAPYLPEGSNQKWHILREEAQSALDDKNFARAENLAQQMLEIDHGVCPVGLYILADCRHAANDLEGTRKYLELAKDASIWDFSRIDIPKPYSITQRVMREEIPKYKNQLIDLPLLFKDYLDGDIPGRRLFLDYCHMTSEGIQIAMGAAGACVLGALNGVEVPWPSLIGKHSAPARETEGEALFLAALLTAHKAPKADFEHHLCARALSYSAHVAELMLNYIDLQTRPAVPMLMSEADDKLHTLGSPLIHYYLLRLNEKRLDAPLLDVMVDAL